MSGIENPFGAFFEGGSPFDPLFGRKPEKKKEIEPKEGLQEHAVDAKWEDVPGDGPNQETDDKEAQDAE